MYRLLSTERNVRYFPWPGLRFVRQKFFGTTLNAAGTTQGQNLSVTAQHWSRSGSALATGHVDTGLTGSMQNGGELMSQGRFTLSSVALNNTGSLLAAGDLSLTGSQYSNRGTLQGNTLSLAQGSIDDQGTLIGLEGLVLNSSGFLNMCFWDTDVSPLASSGKKRRVGAKVTAKSSQPP